MEAERWLLVSEQPLDIGFARRTGITLVGLISRPASRPEAVHQGEYIPQMLNLQALDGISFTKGCYMGQEIVARAKYRGANNRALRAGWAGQWPCCQRRYPGRSSSGDNWRRSGMVLNAWRQDGQLWLTAVLPKDTEADASFRLLKQEEGSCLALQPPALLP